MTDFGSFIFDHAVKHIRDEPLGLGDPAPPRGRSAGVAPTSAKRPTRSQKQENCARVVLEEALLTHPQGGRFGCQQCGGWVPDPQRGSPQDGDNVLRESIRRARNKQPHHKTLFHIEGFFIIKDTWGDAKKQPG